MLKIAKEKKSKAMYKLVLELNDIIADHRRSCSPGDVDFMNDVVFCKSCGKALLQFCHDCGSKNIETNDYLKVCYNCGAVKENFLQVEF